MRMTIPPGGTSPETSSHLMMLNAPTLRGLPGIAHAFFTRQGGVSEGVYASLNGGLGSRDERARVLENRARMAAALDVAPSRFASL
jgi:polyphenol oxidase